MRPGSFTFLSKNSNSKMLYDLAELRSSVTSKEGTAPEKRMTPGMHPTLRQWHHYCSGWLPGKPDIIKEAHSRNFNQCSLTCGHEGERMSILSVDRLKQSSPSAMVDGIFSYIKADYNYFFFVFSEW